jgi:regulation of enolase protein 1 (concanavalin A-like superfamily)
MESKEIDLYFRISRIGQNCYVDFSLDGEEWMQIRIAHLDIPDDSTISAGLFACSPQGKDQSVRFYFLTIEELSSDPKETYL